MHADRRAESRNGTSADFPLSCTIDQIGVEERAAAFGKRNLNGSAKLARLKMAPPDLFRFSASNLANDALMQIAKTKEGRFPNRPPEIRRFVNRRSLKRHRRPQLLVRM